MEKLDALTTKGVAAAFATAILVVVTLAAVPADQLDGPLVVAVDQFALASAFLGGRLVMDVPVHRLVKKSAVRSVLTGSDRHKWFNLVYTAMWWIWLSAGSACWISGSTSLLEHFRISLLQVAFIQVVFISAVAVAIHANSLNKKEADADDSPVDGS
ncbi:hypothetical protein [Paraburkholderia sp. HP33-1]|uniref:hypothetical protein n=1 Tax=Paraburkholderia sp. HP33-1 TaxID=2883243 RepID=UPI001F4515D4|nr:hypothetical protein [Paraburkholderia sp. HP33-1]